MGTANLCLERSGRIFSRRRSADCCSHARDTCVWKVPFSPRILPFPCRGRANMKREGLRNRGALDVQTFRLILYVDATSAATLSAIEGSSHRSDLAVEHQFV